MSYSSRDYRIFTVSPGAAVPCSPYQVSPTNLSAYGHYRQQHMDHCQERRIAYVRLVVNINNTLTHQTGHRLPLQNLERSGHTLHSYCLYYPYDLYDQYDLLPLMLPGESCRTCDASSSIWVRVHFSRYSFLRSRAAL